MKKSIFLFFAAILCAIGMNAATPEKLYLTPSSDWNQSNARFAAYFFGNGEKWVSMTKVTGETNLYEVTTPAGYPSVIFCRMNPNAAANNWSNKWNQTGDLAIPTDGKNHFTVPNGTWDGATSTWSIWPIPAEKTYKDITFTITASSAPQIHYWEGGDKMVGSDWNNLPTMSETAVGSGVYTYTVKDVDEFTGVKYLFKIGDLQTADQTTSVDVTANLKDFFPQVAVMGVNNWDPGDKMTVSDDYKSASVTLTLNEIKKYALKLKIGNDWKGHKDQNHITRGNNSSVFKDNDGDGSIDADYVGDYVFTYTYANQTLTVTYPELPAVKTYKDIVITVVANVTPKIHYWDGGDKVVATDWETKPDMVATGAANTYSYTIKDVDEALGVKYIIVAGAAQTEDLHTFVDVTANFKDLLPAVEVMGINGWNAGEGIPMTIAEDYSASATINFTETKTQEFKLTVGGAWKGHSENNKITRANNSSAFTEDSGNASVKVDVAGDYVFTYTYSDKKLTVTYPASDEPIVPHYYITGSFNSNNVADPNHEMTLDGTVYKATVTLAAGDNMLKVTDGTWDNTWGYNELGANYEEVSNPNDYNNIKITLAAEKSITVIFDANATAGNITFVGLTEKAPVVLGHDYYITGSFNENNPAKEENGMTLDGTVYKATVTLAAGDNMLKVTDGTWENTWGYGQLGAAYEEVSDPNDYNNIKITLTAEKSITVIFDATGEGKITFEGLTEKDPVVEDLSKQPSVIYIKCDEWKADNARFAAYFYGTKETWVNMTDADKDGIYEVVNDKKNRNVIFCRMNPASNENKWDNCWNQSADLEIPTTTYLNYWTVTSTDEVWNKPTGKWMMLIGSGDNSEALAAADDQTVEDVYVNRSFTAGQLYTIALPFDLSEALTKTHFGNTVSVIKFAQLNKDENDDLVLLFENALGMAAGKPYVITPSNTIDGFTVNNVVINNTPNNVQQTTTGAQVTMEAVLSASKGATTNGRYWLASDTYLYNVSSALKSLRAVFNIQSTKANVRARVAFGENVETGVDNIVTTDAPVKAIVNGQLIIIRDGVKYNVQGQKL